MDLENKIQKINDYNKADDVDRTLTEIYKSGNHAKTILTNGTFGIIHYGHLKYLEEAKKRGKYLIVGMNSNESIKKIKHYEPFMTTLERAQFLASFYFVDKVIVYNEVNATRLIQKVNPDLYIKGGDYNKETINQKEKKLLDKLGITIEFVGIIPGYSSRNYLKRLGDHVLKMRDGGF